MIFDLRYWLRISEIGIFQSPDLERMLIYQKTFLWESAIYHSMKLPLDAEVAEKFLNGIYLESSATADATIPKIFVDRAV